MRQKENLQGRFPFRDFSKPPFALISYGALSWLYRVIPFNPRAETRWPAKERQPHLWELVTQCLESHAVKGERYARGGLAGFAPSTVKGRLTFPPTSAKRPGKKINRKELRLAMLSAVAATSSRPLVQARGHRIASDLELPLVVSDDAEKLTKSSEAEKILKNIGVWEDVERASERKIRSGKGSVPRTSPQESVSALIVVSKRQGAERAFGNFSGVGVVDVSSLNVSDLAPGTQPGRLTIWTESAIKGLESRVGGDSV